MSWLPARTARKRSAIAPTKSSYAARSISTREPAEQVCPPFCTIAATTTGAAASISASARQHLRRLAAELERAGNVVLRRRGLDQRADLRAPGERDEVDASMRRQRGAGFLADPGHDIERALREADFERQLGEAQRA